MNAGIVQALAAYLWWGLFPIYYKLILSLPLGEILAHRALWSFVFVAAVLILRRQWSGVARAFRSARTLGTFALSTALVFVNWAAYVVAIATDRITDASLGYFINPLMSVLLGALLLGERLRRMQWLAVGLAALGVAQLTWHAGTVPWIGLAIALSFTLYGLIRKTAPLGAVEGLCLESLFMLPFALAYIGALAIDGRGLFLTQPPTMTGLVMLSGIVSATPLLLFAAAARRIPLSTLGLIQYLAPSMQLVLAVHVYGEPFARGKALGFVAIWVGLATFTAEGLWRAWRNRRNEARRGSAKSSDCVA